MCACIALGYEEVWTLSNRVVSQVAHYEVHLVELHYQSEQFALISGTSEASPDSVLLFTFYQICIYFFFPFQNLDLFFQKFHFSSI